MSSSTELELFHTGIVVNSLPDAMADLTNALGVTWRRVLESGPFAVWTVNGPETVSLRRVYSQEGPPYVELIQQHSGVVWGEDLPGGQYHLGYWCDDLAREVSQLENRGFRRMVCDINEGGAPRRFAFLRSPFGTTFELIPRSRESEVLA